MLKFIAALLFAQVLLAAPMPFCHPGYTGPSCIYNWEQDQHKRVEEERTAQQQAEERKHNNGVAGGDTNYCLNSNDKPAPAGSPQCTGAAYDP